MSPVCEILITDVVWLPSILKDKGPFFLVGVDEQSSKLNQAFSLAASGNVAKREDTYPSTCMDGEEQW